MASRRKSRNVDGTRRTLLDVARREFAARGYDAVTADEIARSAGVTRAMLYYHFGDKRNLFFEICDEVERECSERITGAAARTPGLWRKVHAGCQVGLDTFLDPLYRRIMLIDAPGVLGWEKWRQVLNSYGRDMLRVGLEAAMDANLVDAQPVGPLVLVLSGAINEAGMAIAHAKNPVAERRATGKAIARLLDGLRSPGLRRRRTTRT
jgi:AcrR family transcriptional regulator